jgi:hypothetical protein
MTSKGSHLAARGTKAKSHPDWWDVADDLSGLTPLLSGRDDLKVVVAPGAAGTAPGSFTFATRVIELDADLCFEDLNPFTIHITNVADHHRYLPGLGVFAHECAHAAHTRWRPGPRWPMPVIWAAMLLEDLRIEAAQLRRRPLDRAWLRAAALRLDVPDLQRARPRSWMLWQAASAAALCMGRVDAGVLDPAHPAIGPVHTAFTTALGEDLYTGLEAIWRAALTVADTDGPAMGTLGAAWCRLLTRPGTVIAAADDRQQTALAEATELAAEAIAEAAYPLTGPGGASPQPPVSDLFAYTRPPMNTHPPSPEQRSAATRLAKAMADAAQPPREQITIDTAAPPGKLNMRGALSGAAQKAAGAPVTATPWRRTVRKRQPTPAVKVGVALDVSGSMDVFFAPAATAAWMLAIAAKRTGGMAAAATFGQRARALIAPGKVPAAIPVPEMEWGTNHLDVVIDALDDALALGKPDQHARLLFLITDGWLFPNQLPPVKDQCERLQRNGCEIIQIGPTQSAELEHCRMIEVADPVASLHLLTKTATAALRDAARRNR